MSTDWRDFEELVARIEETLAPKGAVVKSPDRVRDLVTGRLREVDASIRLTVGSTPILVTIECRKRKNVQDDTWIEQLATKRAKIGAAKTIAVSATGFTASAVRTAELHGIEIRTLEDRIGEEIVQQFLAGLQLSLVVTDYVTRTIAFRLDGGVPLAPEEYADELRDAMSGEKPTGVVATEVSTGRVLTIERIVRSVGDPHIPQDGVAVVKNIVATLPPGAFSVLTKSGPRALGGIELVVEFTSRFVPAPAASLHEYASPDRPIRRTLEAVATIDEGDIMRLFVDLDSPRLERPSRQSGAGTGAQSPSEDNE
jgi:hypothetical protein